MWNVCPRCNHLNNDDTVRCEQCGLRLSRSPPVERSSAPATPKPVLVNPKTQAPQPPAPEPPKVTVQQNEKAPSPIAAVSGPKHSYLDEWFISYDHQRRQRIRMAWGAIGFVILIFMIAYAVSGALCNTFLWLVLGVLLAWFASNVAKDKWPIVKVIGICIFVLFPVFLLAVYPWPTFSEPEVKEPEFVDFLGYSHQGGNVTVDGYVQNQGEGGGQATIRLTAYGGPPQNAAEIENLSRAYQQGYMTTGWVEPWHTAQIHWVCYLSYFNSQGEVTWEIIDTTI